MFMTTMKISDLNVVCGLLNICTAASAASRDFSINSSETEKIRRFRFLVADMELNVSRRDQFPAQQFWQQCVAQSGERAGFLSIRECLREPSANYLTEG